MTIAKADLLQIDPSGQATPNIRVVIDAFTSGGITSPGYAFSDSFSWNFYPWSSDAGGVLVGLSDVASMRSFLGVSTGGAPLGSATPQPLGTASPGTSSNASREDHVHQLPAIPIASSSAPLIEGTAAVGTSSAYARADHVHPAQTLPTVPSASSTLPIIEGTATIGTSATYARADHVHPAQTLPSVPVASNATPLIEGAASAGSATDFSRSDHVHPALALLVTPSTPTRAFGAAFKPSTTKPVLCVYSINLSVTNPLLAGASTATVVLFSDAVTTPTTERGRVSNSSSVGLSVTLQLTTPQTVQLSYLCPPGHNVLLTLTTAGTASASIISQTEVVLG